MAPDQIPYPIETFYANFGSIIVIFECISVDRYDQTLFKTIMLYDSHQGFHTKEVPLAVAILNNYPQYFYHPLLADTEHIPIASNLKNVLHDA